MANEIQAAVGLSGKTCYALIRSSTGTIWSTVAVAFQSYLTANYANYPVSMTEQGSASGFYVGNFPTQIPAGVYSVVVKQQIGGSPAETDPNVAQGDLQWNGTGTAPLSDAATSGLLGQFFPVKMTKGQAFSGFLLDLVSSTDHVTPLVSGICSGQVSKDGAAYVALQSGIFNEVGLGTYAVSLTSGDLNCRMAMLRFTALSVSGGASDPRRIGIVLQPMSGY